MTIIIQAFRPSSKIISQDLLAYTNVSLFTNWVIRSALLLDHEIDSLEEECHLLLQPSCANIMQQIELQIF